MFAEVGSSLGLAGVRLTATSPPIKLYCSVIPDIYRSAGGLSVVGWMKNIIVLQSEIERSEYAIIF